MHFDQRTQRALREFGLSADEVREVSEAVVEATAEEAAALEAFFDGTAPAQSELGDREIHVETTGAFAGRYAAPNGSVSFDEPAEPHRPGQRGESVAREHGGDLAESSQVLCHGLYG